MLTLTAYLIISSKKSIASRSTHTRGSPRTVHMQGTSICRRIFPANALRNSNPLNWWDYMYCNGSPFSMSLTRREMAPLCVPTLHLQIWYLILLSSCETVPCTSVKRIWGCIKLTPYGWLFCLFSVLILGKQKGVYTRAHFDQGILSHIKCLKSGKCQRRFFEGIWPQVGKISEFPFTWKDCCKYQTIVTASLLL